MFKRQILDKRKISCRLEWEQKLTTNGHRKTVRIARNVLKPVVMVDVQLYKFTKTIKLCSSKKMIWENTIKYIRQT